jgi:23S rRNA (uridine2552-2'-O)-methyltransferase
MHYRIRDALTGIGKESFQSVLSDAMVKTSGNGSIDHSASYVLGNRVMEIANVFLSPGGSCVFKHFQGDMTQDLFRKWKDYYRFSRITNTRASRHGSREIYMIFKGKL